MEAKPGELETYVSIAFQWASDPCEETAGGGDDQPHDLENPHELGRVGEEIAARFLEEHGYEIIERNWRSPSGEADIVARDVSEATDVLVEVKTRLGGLPDPFSSINDRKLRRYRDICLWYLMQNRDEDCVRFDAVAVNVVRPHVALVNHAVGAFSWDS